MNRSCPSCDAVLGPQEGPRCVSCRPLRPGTNFNIITAVLEQAEGPLHTWDIEREARSRYGCGVWFSYLGYDYRVCWAGRSTWGLYRHGLVPGVRSLSRAAALFVKAAGTIQTKPLYFVMRRAGYRFSPNSLSGALSYEPWVRRAGWQNHPVSSRSVRQEMREELKLGRRLTLTDVLQRLEEHVERELVVYSERLGAT